ncbi:MAG: hypothetical protein IPO83_12310 [Chitinophagaceae bacterium]|nr:hypothetical protein [Chitinophagaceae bacterium]
MTPDEWITIIVLGIYTVINGLVWNFQKNKIKELDTLLTSIKTYTDIFDMNKISEYVKLMEKKSEIDAKNKAQRVLKKLKEELSQESTQYVDDRYKEYMVFIIDFLLTMTEENRRDFIKKNFPKTGETLLDSLKILDKP